MSTPIQWKHGRARRRPREEPRPLSLIKSALGELARVAEHGADEQVRGLFARLDGGRLPGFAGGGRAQGRPLHDPEGDLHGQEVA